MSHYKNAIDKYKKLPIQLKAAVWFLVCSFLQKGISVITTPIFTRIMSTSEYGEYSAFNSWLGILTIIISMSLYLGVHAQGLIKFSEEQDIFSASLQGLTLTLVSIWTVVYFAFSSIWNHLFSLTTVQMLSLLILIWTSAVFNFWANEQRVKYSYRLLVAVTLIVSIAKPAIEILLILNSDDKVTARILGIVIVELAGYSWMFFYQLKRGRTFFSKKYWKYALAYNIPLVPHYLSQIVLNSADRIMIRDMVGASEAGIYNLAYSLALIMTLFNTALMQTLNPWMYQKIKEKKEQEMAPMAYMTLIIIAVVNLLLIIVAPEAVAIFAPKEYHDAIWIVPPVAMSVYFMYSYDLFAKSAFYYEKTKFIMVASVMCAISNIVLNYFAIKQFGYIAAGYTTLICYILYSVTHYYFMIRVCRQECDERYPYNTVTIIKITIPFLVAGFLILLTYQNNVIRYIVLIIAIVAMLIKCRTIIDAFRKIVKARNENTRV